MFWEQEGAALKVGQVTWFRFRFEDAQHQPADDSEPYMVHGRSRRIREIGSLRICAHSSGWSSTAAVTDDRAKGVWIAHGAQLDAFGPG